MKSIKYYALGLLSAAFLIVVLIACSNEEPTNMQSDQSGSFIPFKSDNVFTGSTVATIVNGDAVPLFNEDSLKVALVSTKFFGTVESVKINYGINPVDNNPEAIMTIIGTEPGTSAALALVADLKVEGDKLIILNPETNPTTFSTHTCTGSNCLQCDFKRQGLLGRVVGCEPCSAADDSSLPGRCNHTNTSGGGKLLKVVLEIAKFVLTL